RAVVPAGNALSGVPSAKKAEPGDGPIDFAAFAGDLDEKAALTGGDRAVRLWIEGGGEKFEALVEGCARVRLVRERPREDEYDLIHYVQGGVGQRQVGNGYRVETAREYSQPLRRKGSGRAPDEPHNNQVNAD